MTASKGILVIGAYGLIGQSVVHRLLAVGISVSGLGRSKETADKVWPDIPWHYRDIRQLCDVEAWLDILENYAAVVNCSGALQDGPNDDLEAVHYHAVDALANACAAAQVQLIQISAIGAHPKASTHFMSSKGRGDQAIQRSGADYWIFRPGLVLAQNAYGGTALLRMLAAVPSIQPIALPDAEIQTVAATDVAEAVVAAVDRRIPSGFEGDLAEHETHSLAVVIKEIRNWLGFKPAQMQIVIPAFATRLLSKFADGLARLGWRSPLRSTALRVLEDGIVGKPADLTQHGLAPFTSLRSTLRQFPVGSQDRLAARMSLLVPLIIVTLSVFWIASGLIGLLRVNVAADVLEAVGWSTGFAMASVIFWSLIDIAIGVAFVIRKYAYAACWAAVCVGLFYMAASTLTVPHLWADPLGPLVKIIPSVVLALVARAALETR